eukprot:TRINITY_DN13175_c0_g4_i1.p1 TRINITY_DN13175_c0_g4~~TRINITY_DN13175_c0_g4_i1.p1  ORF type:complete len:223 (-),score=43.90 TRINITY_DN13175_c0_g4_i1:555-1223(-)
MSLRILTLYLLAVHTLARPSKGIVIKHHLTDTSCFKKNSYSFIVLRAFISLGTLDYNIAANLRALPDGLEFVDVYMNPCMACPYSAEAQVEKLVDGLKEEKYRKLWIMAQAIAGWKRDTNENCKFLNDLLRKARELGRDVGIATNKKEWHALMGPSCEVSEHSTELWLIGDDNSEGIKNFEKFSVFKRPAMKELVVPVYQCGGDAKVVINYKMPARFIKADL